MLIDGLGMFTNTYNVIGNRDIGSDSTLNDIVNTGYSDYVFKNMLSVQMSRVLILSLLLFPVFYFVLRCRMRFPAFNPSDMRTWIPYIRVVFGILVFYYLTTIGTVFSHELFTNYYSFGHWLSCFRIVGSFVVLGAFLLDYPSAISTVKNFPVTHPHLYKVSYIIVIAVISCMLLEFQAASKMNMTSHLLLLNIFYWVIVQVFIDVITGNVKIGAIVSLVFSYLIGLINDIVFQFRGNYVMYGDITVVRTAMEVAGNYTYKFGFWFWLCAVLLIVSIVLTVLLKFPRHDKIKPKDIVMRAAAALAVVAGVIITFSNGLLYFYVFGVGWDYNKNVRYTGYIPYFLSNMNAISKVTLDGYDPDIVAGMLEGESGQGEGQYQSPNIIIIQNEAFADLSILYDIETNQDYMPFIHSLNENTRKGYLNMSITGGPTANTEFEVLTRSTMNFLPFGAVPYTQYVNDDIPTVPAVLEDQPIPYHTVAYHPYYASGYRRTTVYDHFGFDEIVFEDNFREEFPEADLPREYLSDEADYRRVEEMYEDFRAVSDDPWFCFNVTIQNHGGYTQIYDPPEADRIYVTNFTAADPVNSYLSLIKRSDDAFRSLIEYFSQCDEPTVIAMYGDHQPSFDGDSLESLSGHTGDRLNNYYVPYVIWANYDIEEEDLMGYEDGSPALNVLSTNYFASMVFEVAGIELSDYDKYLLELHEYVPAITAVGVWDNEGNYYSSIEESPYSDELSALRMVQYNLIFDDENRFTERFI